MKYIFYSLFTLSLFVSCKSNNKGTTGADSTRKAGPADRSQILLSEFKPIIQGVWIKKDYLEKIEQTRSVAAADDLKTGITEMYINTDSIHGDSIVLVAGYFNHDSGNVVIRFRPGKDPSSIQFNSGSLRYTIAADTTITISEFDERKKQIVNTTFTRVLNRQTAKNLEYGMTYAINKRIIAGNYQLTDTTGKMTKVKLTDDGNVSGFLNFDKYAVAFDLNEEPMANLDELYFNSRKKIYQSFAYKIDNDTLSLYDEHANSDSTELIAGKRIYKLVKQK